ncbi:MAG: hypothetical protein JXX29_02420 [Deltaproteobacteria bacterium]|nr:hypothetical protein [Deltaproteobacteria bacterium]MBN2670496.1 hypothetical protein [Deltaproteobacteria bacterium]
MIAFVFWTMRHFASDIQWITEARSALRIDVAPAAQNSCVSISTASDIGIFGWRLVRIAIVAAVALTVCLGACGDANSETPNIHQVGQSIDENTVLPEGVYLVSSQTENPVACDMPGTVEIAGQGYMAAVAMERVGWWTLRLVSCESVAACRRVIDSLQIDASGFTGDAYDLSDVSAAGFYDETFQPAVSPDENSACVGGKLIVRDLVVDGETLHLTVYETPSETYPADENGSCFTADIQEAVSNNPCGERKDFFLEKIE